MMGDERWEMSRWIGRCLERGVFEGVLRVLGGLERGC